MRPATVYPSIKGSQTLENDSQQTEFIAQFKNVLLRQMTYYSVFVRLSDE